VDDIPNWVNPTSGPGTHFCFFAWVRSSTTRSPAKLQIREYEPNGSRDGAALFSDGVLLSADWQLLEAEFVSIGTASSTLDFQILDFQPAVGGEVFDTTDIAIRRRP
jgi:hypothetical protein